jgi:hypothetical protein
LTGAPNSGGLPEAALRHGATLAVGDDSDNYLYEVNFTGAGSGTQHAMYLYVAGGSVVSGALASIAQALATFAPGLLNAVASQISGMAGSAIADGADAVAGGAAEEAAVTAGVTLATGVAAFAGAVAAVLALTALILDLTSADFQLQVSVVNQSSKNYMILPNYYLQNGASELVAAADSCAYFNMDPQYIDAFTDTPPTICSSQTLFPFSACAQAFDGTNMQASQYGLVYQHDGYNAPGVMLQLLECGYTPPAAGETYGTLSPSLSESGWIGLVVNPHYHTDDAPNIAMFVAGANLLQAEPWFDQYSDTTPSSTGSQASLTTTLNWVLADGDPVQDPNTGMWIWHLLVTITDTA